MVIQEAMIINKDNSQEIKENFKIQTNFNFDKINNLYSDLSSITAWGLIRLKQEYKSVNYSTIEIDYQFQKIISYPFI